jgi:hypothetical protein
MDNMLNFFDHIGNITYNEVKEALIDYLAREDGRWASPDGTAIKISPAYLEKELQDFSLNERIRVLAQSILEIKASEITEAKIRDLIVEFLLADMEEGDGWGHPRFQDWNDTLWETASVFGDMDTTCAIVGGILGAYEIDEKLICRRELLPLFAP